MLPSLFAGIRAESPCKQTFIPKDLTSFSRGFSELLGLFHFFQQCCSVQSSFTWEEKELLPINHHKKDTGSGMACLGEQMSGMRRPGSSFTCIARSCTLSVLEMAFLRSIWHIVCKAGASSLTYLPETWGYSHSRKRSCYSVGPMQMLVLLLLSLFAACSLPPLLQCLIPFAKELRTASCSHQQCWHMCMWH